MQNTEWWKNTIAYQIYPKSFKDTNNDGIGDLKGIIQKLDYLKNLGIDVIWICPIYKSPNDDNGYDISDYQDIMESLGTMEDFDRLLRLVHAKGMKLIMDLVINHTSDEHKWFIESKASKNSPKRDWYIWKEGKVTKEPNNWESIFKGSAWEKDEKTNEYFLHLFSKRQPDLNWENIEVRKALYKMINWWLEKGIDGFRIDAISHIKKDTSFSDMPNPQFLQYVPAFSKIVNMPGIENFLAELKSETFSKYDIMTVGEANGVHADDATIWVDEKQGAFNMIFQFNHLTLWDEDIENHFSVKRYKTELQKWQDALYQKGWNALFIENHDQPRVVSNWGNDTIYWSESAKAFALSYFMQQGTPFIYQGQEIGMTNIEFDCIKEYNDIGTINAYKKDLSKGLSKKEALAKANITSRDNSRTPMQWDDTSFAGFTSGETTWLKINPNFTHLNVRHQLNDTHSILHFYKQMITLRKGDLTFTSSPCKLLLKDHAQIHAYTREGENTGYIIICNLSNEEAIYDEPNYSLSDCNILLKTHESIPHTAYTTLHLKPWEARLYKL